MFKRKRKDFLLREKYLGALLFFFICSSISTFSQVENKEVADSLFKKSKKLIKNNKLEEALFYAEKSLVFYKKEELYKSIGNNLNVIATIYYYKNDFPKALSIFNSGIKYYQKINYEKGIASILNNKGAIHYYLGNYSVALENYKQAIKSHEKLNNLLQIAITTQNIGGIYLELNNLKNAMKNFQKAKEVFLEKNDTLSLSQVTNSIGEVYLKQKYFTKSYKSFKEALLLAKKNNQRKLEVFFNMGKYYKEIDDIQKSYSYYKTSLAIAKELNNSIYQSSSLVKLGIHNLDLNKIELAITNCKMGYNLSRKIKVISVEQDACRCLYKAYKKKNRKSMALFYFEKMHQLKDSLNLKQITDKILNMKYEKEILLDSIESVEKERKIRVLHQKEVAKKEKQRNVFIVAICFITLVTLGVLSRLNFMRKSRKRLQIEKDRSENLLLNILPEQIAEELKEKGYVDVQDFDTVAVLFTDFKSFTETSEKMSPQELVEEINTCFRAFDIIIEKYDIEKIKTIGDAYMAAGGLTVGDNQHVKKTVLAAVEMQEFIAMRKKQNDKLKKPAFEMRVGIHVGHLVAGIVGVKKFQYDIWGDAVNVANRMESNGEIGKVNISQSVYEILKNDTTLIFTSRGNINTKGKRRLAMYFVEKSKKQFCQF